METPGSLAWPYLYNRAPRRPQLGDLSGYQPHRKPGLHLATACEIGNDTHGISRNKHSAPSDLLALIGPAELQSQLQLISNVRLMVL